MTIDIGWAALIVTVSVIGLYLAIVIALWRFFLKDEGHDE